MIINIEPTDNYELIFTDKVYILNDIVCVLEYSLLYKQKIKIIDRVVMN